MKPEPLPSIFQRADFDCATAAWKCVYAYHYGRNPRVRDLSNAIQGTDPSTLEAVIRNDRGWHVHAGESMVEDLRHYAATWRPSICLVTLPTHGYDSHYVVCGGVWRGRAYYHCPSGGWQSAKVSDFETYWHGMGRHRNFRKWSLAAWPAV